MAACPPRPARRPRSSPARPTARRAGPLPAPERTGWAGRRRAPARRGRGRRALWRSRRDGTEPAGDSANGRPQDLALSTDPCRDWSGAPLNLYGPTSGVCVRKVAPVVVLAWSALVVFTVATG